MHKSAFALLPLVLAACHSAPPPQMTTLDDRAEVARGTTYRWSFDDRAATPGTGTPLAPEHPRTFINVLGKWDVEKDARAASAPNVYRQRAKYDEGSPRVVVSELVFGDMSLRAMCRPESGAEAGCGVMLRVADQDSYLVVRADAKTSTLKLVRVLGGNETELASAPANVSQDEWHTIAIKTRAEKVVVWWDEMRLISAEDERLPPGKVGFWTRAETTAAFDDLEVRAD